MNGFKKPSYVKQYQGKSLLIKASGKELGQDTFSNIEELSKNNVNIVLAYGGGVTIDKYWNQYSQEQRKKIDGVGVTSQEIMENAVMPAYDEIHSRISHQIEGRKNFIYPENIKSDYKDIWKYKEVGTIKEIEGVDFQVPLNLIGFVGDANGHLLNINADEIVTYMVDHYSNKINEVLFLSDQPGLLNTKKELVSLILKSNIDNILDGLDENITVDGGMTKKLQEIQCILERVPKVVLTQGKYLYDEINHWRGKGTMFIDDSEITLAPLDDRLMFYEVFTQYIYEEIFRPRSGDELEDIMNRHTVISIANTILGGFSLKNVGEKHMLIECLWSSYVGTGLGTLILNKAKSMANRERRKLFLISSSEKLGASFEKNNFYNHGAVSEYAMRGEEVEIKKYLMEYPISRGKSFLYKKK